MSATSPKLPDDLKRRVARLAASGGQTPDGFKAAATLGFWILKILATTPGETGGDSVSMSMNVGYLLGTGIVLVVFVGAVLLQIRAGRFHPLLYWATIVATEVSRTALFWSAFVLTRPLGAVVGDFLGKPVAQGGLALSRYAASAALPTVMTILILALPQRPAARAH